MDPIHYGDVVGLSHPGTYSRISKDHGKEFLQFTVLGGEEGTVVPNCGVIALEQNPPDCYSLLSADQKWKVTFSGEGPLHTGARIRLEAIPEGSREDQLYLIYRIQIDPIEHVVLLMMENRSFFRVYGYMDPLRDTYVNKSESGKEFRSCVSNDLETPDPPHEIPYVNTSLEGEKHDGYVKAYEQYHKKIGTAITDEDLQDIMGYTKKGFLPALHRFEDFASICSQWYCSLRGPTWPNRMFALSGTCFGWKTTPEMNAKILTDLKDFLKEWHLFKPPHPQKFSVYDILDETKTSYNIYTDTPLEFTLSGDVFYPALHDDDMDKFRKHAKDGTLPAFSFIEPNFVHMPNFGFIQNDDHPPANPLKAQKFIADVYNTLRESPKWKNTLFIVTYDEHGGFFDPVIPPPAPVPDAVSKDDKGTFASFGVRVPTVLVSPCVKHGIDNEVYDHTSVLKYVLLKWAPEGVNQLGERVKYANTLPVLRHPRDLDEFPPITDDDFLPLKEHRAANKKIDDHPGAPERKLPLHQAAAIAIKDPEVERQLREIIVHKRIAKATGKGVSDEALEKIVDTIEQQAHEQEQVEIKKHIEEKELEREKQLEKEKEEKEKEKEKEKDEGIVEHAIHELKNVGDKIAHAFSDLFGASHTQGPPPQTTQTTPYPSAHAPEHTPAPASSQQQPQQAAKEVVSEATRFEAERYADDIIRKIAQGVDAQTEENDELRHAVVANQIRATSISAEKLQGSNDLARMYLQLLQVRAKKHAKKINAKGKAV